EFQKRGGFIFANFLPTFYETILGFLIGALIGVVSGLGIVYSRILWLTIYPSLVVIGSIPRIAIAPLILIWLGIDSIWSKVTIAFLVAFFPMVVNSVVGFSQIDGEMLDLAKTMGMKPWTEFRKIRLPNSVPYLFAGFKASIALAVIGAVVAEFVSGQQGLGYLIIEGKYVPFFVARDKGFFKKNGLDVTLIEGKGSGNSATFVDAGQAEYSYGDLLTALQVMSKGGKNRAIGVGMTFNGGGLIFLE